MSFAYDPSGLTLPAAHFIAGEYITGPAAIRVLSPSTGKILGDIPCADADVVDHAVRAARTALASSNWGGMQPRDRTRALCAWADLMEAEAKTLAAFEAVCSSRPFADVLKGDIVVTAEQIRFFAELADKECGALAPVSDGHFGYIADEPYGVIGAITPWNFPISMAGWKLGPALAAGNAVVLKPSEMTPYSTLFMAELCVRAFRQGFSTSFWAMARPPGTRSPDMWGSTRYPSPDRPARAVRSWKISHAPVSSR